MVHERHRCRYRQEHKDLIDSVRAGKPIADEGNCESCDCSSGRMAAYTGQSVKWDFATEDSKLDLFARFRYQRSRPNRNTRFLAKQTDLSRDHLSKISIRLAWSVFFCMRHDRLSTWKNTWHRGQTHREPGDEDEHAEATSPDLPSLTPPLKRSCSIPK